MVRTDRQDKILELIEHKDIETQAELTSELVKAGFQVTQATVSRDIKDLGLIKAASARGYKYLYGQNNDHNSRLLNIFKESVISIQTAMNLIVLKTMSGSANSACVIIDKLNIEGVVGTLAGDDNLVVIVKNLDLVDSVTTRLKNLMQKK
ncbi:MAG: arginine repressor [Clostridia bacterium]|nr:arginine repressor [Clostridia bacterium]